MFRAQRNFYLTGFCLVLLIVIGRIYKLLKQVNKLEATSEALRKQAEGAANPNPDPNPNPNPDPDPDPDPDH